ncbi:MAG TPA: 3-methyladenine DNA glycosylase [Candidatus Nesterenkonia stercoripullorum]|uniref:3-methyladenine DNA glycosylase n=1 Tax=Candidatus Nesterenkonia stercoripullorum TaxID=2838701 RepID=A0A9D1UT98_9MICC|nr:3-methyladenine DNA glycosylase [Candidatus Nesterenkonia stercoripullorum]
MSEHERDAAQREHQERVSTYTSDFLARRHTGKKHPVEDFLFTYYSHSPGQLSRWHAGAGTVVVDSSDSSGTSDSGRASGKFYTRTAVTAPSGEDLGGVTVDVVRFRAERASIIDFARRLLSTTARKPAQLGCFGLHEWAMVYRSEHHGQRHEEVPLRLGAEGTDEVVESLNIRCTHFDAYRFYTPSAAPLNTHTPTRQKQVQMEQPGCLHANMDLYKWAYKLLPAVSSELLLDCFDLAWRIRELDMRASPYDLQEWGYEPVRIETPSGRAAYAKAQKGFAQEANNLRQRLLSTLDRVDALATRALP